MSPAAIRLARAMAAAWKARAAQSESEDALVASGVEFRAALDAASVADCAAVTVKSSFTSQDKFIAWAGSLGSQDD